jgi:transposase, IS5 family
MMDSRYAHAKQFKRHHRQLRLLRSRLGRIIRDIRRKITGRPELEAVFEAPIARAAQIRSQQQRQRGWKLYSSTPPRSNASSMKGCGSPGCRKAEVRSGCAP